MRNILLQNSFHSLFLLGCGLYNRNSQVKVTVWSMWLTLANGHVHFMAFSLTMVLVPNALQMEGMEQSFVFVEIRVCCVSTYAGR